MKLFKKAVSVTAIFLLDLFVILVSTYLFSLHIAMKFVGSSLPDQKYFGLLKIFFSLVLLLIYRGIHALAQRYKPKICPYIEGTFFVFITLIGVWIAFVVSRSIMIMQYPRFWILFSVLFGLGLAWLLPKQLKWRKAPLFISCLLSFNLLFEIGRAHV